MLKQQPLAPELLHAFGRTAHESSKPVVRQRCFLHVYAWVKLQGAQDAAFARRLEGSLPELLCLLLASLTDVWSATRKASAQRLGDVLGGKAGGAGHGAGSPTLRARPLTAGAAQNRIQWHGGGRLAAYLRPDAAASKPAVLPPSTARAVRPILRRPRNPAAESELTEGPARFAALALPAAESLFRPPAQVRPAQKNATVR